MKVLVDDEVSCRLGAIREIIELRDTQGRIFGYFQPLPRPVVVSDDSIQSPFSDEEIASRRAEPGGRPLEEIWKDLGRQ